MYKEIPDWMTEEALQTLNKGYLLNGETPLDMWKRVSKACSEYLSMPEIYADLLECLYNGYIGLSTPVAANFGRKSTYGLPVSCFANHVSDNIHSIYSHLKESAALSKYGGGTATFFGDIRASGSSISGGGTSTGIAPWIRQYDLASSIVTQGNTRRGNTALYVPIDHPDLLEVLRAKDHTKGDPRKFIDSNIGVTITDSWIESLLDSQNPDKEKKKIFDEVLKIRLTSGSPYLVFIDTANNQNPECYNVRNLKVSTSNLCSEIFLHTDEDHTFVCVLCSMNVLKYPEWQDYRGQHTGLSAPALAIYLLEAVVEEFIIKASKLQSMGRAVRFAKKSRALGLGSMGLAALYQRLGVPFESARARQKNIEIHEYIKTESDKASQQLAQIFGEPEWCIGSGFRHTHRTAIAPTRSNSVICGAYSQGIEPIEGNYYSAKQAKGSFVRKNPFLTELLDKLGQNTYEVWQSILSKNGSVQHLDFLDEHDKKVFKTAREINQFEIIRQAADRQPFVCQGQSVNLFVNPDCSPEYLYLLHLSAWKMGLKSLYYLKAKSNLFKKSELNYTIVSRDDCNFCKAAKAELKNRFLPYREITVEQAKTENIWKDELTTVPQIWYNNQYIGGYSELINFFNKSNPIDSTECEVCHA